MSAFVIAVDAIHVGGSYAVSSASSQMLLDTRRCKVAIDVCIGMVDIIGNVPEPTLAPGGIVNGVALKPIADNLMGLSSTKWRWAFYRHDCKACRHDLDCSYYRRTNNVAAFKALLALASDPAGHVVEMTPAMALFARKGRTTITEKDPPKMLQEFTKTVLVIVAGLFPLINPPASALIVTSLFPHPSAAERAELARRIAFNSFMILLASLSIGAYVLSFFGISIPVLRVAGGIVIAMAGWNLLHSPSEELTETTPTPKRSASLSSQAFFPLTLPITVGPGAIAVAIALGTGSPREGLLPVHIIGVGVALVFLCSSVYICVRFSGHLEKLLGTVGTQVAMRLFAFAIFCIGVQIFWLGLSELLGSLHLK